MQFDKIDGGNFRVSRFLPAHGTRRVSTHPAHVAPQVKCTKAQHTSTYASDTSMPRYMDIWPQGCIKQRDAPIASVHDSTPCGKERLGHWQKKQRAPQSDGGWALEGTNSDYVQALSRRGLLPGSRSRNRPPLCPLEAIQTPVHGGSGILDRVLYD